MTGMHLQESCFSTTDRASPGKKGWEMSALFKPRKEPRVFWLLVSRHVGNPGYDRSPAPVNSFCIACYLESHTFTNIQRLSSWPWWKKCKGWIRKIWVWSLTLISYSCHELGQVTFIHHLGLTFFIFKMRACTRWSLRTFPGKISLIQRFYNFHITVCVGFPLHLKDNAGTLGKL